MTITLTREEAQQVLDALEGSIDAQQWEIDDHITKYGEWYRPQRVECMKQQLADTNKTIETLRTRLSQPEPAKLWLWKNFVDGKPEYWAFDNPYPTNLEDGDPQTLGQPCGYAIFKPSRDGSNGRTEEQVLREMASVKLKPQLEPKPVAWLVENKQNPTRRYVYTAEQLQELGYGNISTEPFNILAPLYTAPPQREWVGLTDDEVDEAEKEFGVWRGRVAKQSFESGAWWANEKLLEKNT
jgi:hypothetical protein